MGRSILDQGKFDAANHGFRVMFDETLASADDMALANLLATTFQSSSSDETYTWLGAAPTLKPWMNADADSQATGGSERVISKLRSSSYVVKNLRWANGIEVDEQDFEDDKLGLIGMRVRSMAQAAAAHYVQLLIDLLTGGFSQNGYDAVPFFSATHPNGDAGTFDNLMTATLDDSLAYDTAYKKMLSMKNENGDPAGVRPTHLVVGPDYRTTALALLVAEVGVSGASNVNANSAELIVSPRLSGAHAAKWFLLDLSKPIRPLVLQIRQPLLFVPMTRLDDEIRFLRGKFMMGVEGRHNAGYGLPQYAVGSNGST